MGNQTGQTRHEVNALRTSRHACATPSSIADLKASTASANLETFVLVWLDPHVHDNAENVATQQQLRKVLTYLYTFDDVDACEKWLRKACDDEKIILIVSGAFGQQVVPRIHHIPSIVAVYVYCLDTRRNKTWSKDFSKVRSVRSTTEKLLSDLSSHQSSRESVEDSKALAVCTTKQSDQTPDPGTVNLIWYQLLLEILLSRDYLPSTPTPRKLMQILRQYTSGDEYSTTLISEFESTYKPERAVTWLASDSLSRLVSKALRDQDIAMMFALRFLLMDIQARIAAHQVPTRLNVFKVQPMERSSMEGLKANPGQLLAINGFLYASTSMPSVATTSSTHDQFVNVIMNIQASGQQDTAPFAFLDEIEPGTPKEENRHVLFMCGALFEVGQLSQEDSTWILHLKLVSGNRSHQLTPARQRLREKRRVGVVADLLRRSSQIEKAVIFYREIINELPLTHELVPDINRQLSALISRIPATNDQPVYVLVNLAEQMTGFALSVLQVLRSITAEYILTVDTGSTVDVAQWPQREISVFTTARYASLFSKGASASKVFVLEPDANNTERQHFSSIDGMMCHLVEEVIQRYRTDANDASKAAEQNRNIEQIYAELRRIPRTATIAQATAQPSKSPELPVLSWLIKRNNDYLVSGDNKRTFCGFFSDFRLFVGGDELQEHLLDEKNSADQFIVISKAHDTSIVEYLEDIPRVKHVYCCDSNDDKDKERLRYQLNYDLIAYYGKLGERFRARNQRTHAREMFLKAKTLCELLSKGCFAEK